MWRVGGGWVGGGCTCVRGGCWRRDDEAAWAALPGRQAGGQADEQAARPAHQALGDGALLVLIHIAAQLLCVLRAGAVQAWVDGPVAGLVLLLLLQLPPTLVRQLRTRKVAPGAGSTAGASAAMSAVAVCTLGGRAAPPPLPVPPHRRPCSRTSHLASQRPSHPPVACSGADGPAGPLGWSRPAAALPRGSTAA